MSFADNGPGLPDDLEGGVFEPFVSTKPEGLGMGLSISRTIIESQGGKLLAENNSGGGATLRVLLPAHTGDEE
jgi:C4-dicarboxylate-specific signal transduction histidine kinase